MTQQLKPARLVLLASVIFCAAYLAISAFVVICQPLLHKAVYGEMEIQNVYPVPDLLYMALKGAIHIIPAMLLIIMTGKKNEKSKRLQLISLILLIYFSIIQPIINIIVTFLLNFLQGMNSVEFFMARATLLNLLTFPNLLYGMGICLFIISLAMIWYFCYLKRKCMLISDISEHNEDILR